ncbi:MAG: universal stress protein [Gemmatimonadales bacterium]
MLVPLDGSPFAEQAIPLAADIARRAGAIIQFALVHHPTPPMATALEVPEIGAQLEAEARVREEAYLAAQVDRIRAIWSVPVSAVLLDGEVVEALRHHAEATSADLLVLTTHGRGPVSRFWLGSVADQLMHRLHLPLLLVRPGVVGDTAPKIARIMVTLDGSRFAEQALGTAQALAGAYAAEIVLLLVFEPPVPIADPTGLIVFPPTQEEVQRMRDSAERYLASVVARLTAEGSVVTSAAVDGPTVAATIHEQVRAQRIDLLVVASHGAGGFERLLVGSVADKVVRGSEIPTLVVRPDEAGLRSS